ncbi:PREDICTED: inter-alpha-trypsin inhibitor heavy chain H4-like [Gekko japonicus]|uniref:Inter-alpha-trypsin inhibitor heavy chain H4-like n=1 Tax=Gekko japonicus TaxID=146911 RepID=A0ABM1JNC5_GEKJA|nr:PREDICTED: inter-alpha-trypsin inhibitor heavy chain H4-like [Gekko japonicus]
MQVIEADLARDAPWIQIQQDTFTRWCNERLHRVNKHIDNLQYDLSDGLRLIALLEVLSQKPMFLKYHQRPIFQQMHLENVSVALDFLDKENIKLVSIDSKAIVDGNLKLILGLVWTLILHYSVSMPVKEYEGYYNAKQQTPKQRLLGWIQNKIPYLPITNFNQNWQDGKALGALVDSCAPGLCPNWEAWDPKKPLDNVREAMQQADDWLGVPQVITPEEIIHPDVDEYSVMTYLSQFPCAALKNAIEIYSLHVDSKVTSRFAHTVITSKVANRANVSQEALFEVELPKTAFITNFSMTIDGKTYPGAIKKNKAAQDRYDDAFTCVQSTRLVRSTGRKLEQFHVSVSVAAAGKVTFELTYEELLKRKLGKYELLIKVKPKQLVKDFQIVTRIFEPQGISFLETDSTFLTNELSDALTKVQEETKAYIKFKQTIAQQRKRPELEETLLDGDFLIRYDVKRSVTAGDIQIANGYFVHYFAPSEKPAFPKNIVFVIDDSDSMAGKKTQQTKEALQKILEDQNPEDHFNLIIFSSNVTAWKPSLLPATEENVELAKQYVRTIRAQGATDINGALLAAIHALDEATTAELLPEQSISMMILLTDGQPTVGVTDVCKIQENIKQSNNEKYFLYCLGFGTDVDYRFLEKMALDNGGIAQCIYEDADASLQLQNFYHEVATPIMKGIEINYLDNGVQDITQKNFKLLFDVSEIVVAGKIDNELDVFLVEIKAQTQMNNLTLKEQVNVTEKEEIFRNQKYIFGNFIERLWGYLTIQQLLEKSVSAEGEQQKSLKDQALGFSLKFSFVTPLTSMVVTKPDAEEAAK